METIAPPTDRLRTGRGLVLGKFLPPTRGHQLLIEFARQYCGQLTVLLCSLRTDPIPGKLRLQWLREMFPSTDVRIVHETRDLPQTPEDHPEFWKIWKGVIEEAAPDGVDYFFASEEYGVPTARTIGAHCQYIPVDPGRQLVPISARALRAEPMRYWEYIPEPVRPYYVKRVCLFGPESTGKSSLARMLASHFGTVYAHEHARPLLDLKAGRCDPDDLEKIARGQLALEAAMARQANRVLFCDTDVLTTSVWAKLLFDHCPPWLQSLAGQGQYDLTLLLDVDVPWVDDQQRFFSDPGVRRAQLELFRQALESHGRPYTLISGTYDQRLSSAIAAVEGLLESPDRNPR